MSSAHGQKKKRPKERRTWGAFDPVERVHGETEYNRARAQKELQELIEEAETEIFEEPDS